MTIFTRDKCSLSWLIFGLCNKSYVDSTDFSSTPLAMVAHRLPLPVPAPLSPTALSELAQRAVGELLREGASQNTLASYRGALRYWCAWFALRYGGSMPWPLPTPVVLQFVVDHAERTTPQGLQVELPPAIDLRLVADGFKGRPGPLALSTLMHRIAVVSKVHQHKGLVNPCHTPDVRELLSRTRKAYAKRGAPTRKMAALTQDPMLAVLATCDDSLRGKRDRALLLFAWSTGGRRRSEVANATLQNLETCGAGEFIYHLGHSKTNQSAADRPEDNKPVAGMAGQALQDWLTSSGITSGALFRQIRKGGHVGNALSGAAVRTIVKERCTLAGLQARYSAHSLRSGFVTEAGRRNMPLTESKALSGHRSVASFLGYFRGSASLDSPIARLLDPT